jgi:hypothetical protein
MTFTQRYLAHQSLAFRWLEAHGKRTTEAAIVRTMRRYTLEELTEMTRKPEPVER